jgi:hypothetical protein
MKSATKITLRMMFFIITSLTVLSCKQSTSENENQAYDSTAVDNTAVDTTSTLPDTVNTPAPGTPTDTTQNGTDTRRP